MSRQRILPVGRAPSARWLLILALAVPSLAWGQQARSQIGVLPFIDGTGGTGRAAGVAASQTLIDELAAGSRLIGVAIADSSGASTIDQVRAIALGKERGMPFVFVATVLEASSKESNRSGWLPRIKGQTLHLAVHSIEAKTVLQGALYDVAGGQRLFTTTTTGSHKDRAYAGRVWSSWGSWDVGDHSAFLASPMGKAFLEASREMVKQIVEAASTRESTH